MYYYKKQLRLLIQVNKMKKLFLFSLAISIACYAKPNRGTVSCSNINYNDRTNWSLGQIVFCYYMDNYQNHLAQKDSFEIKKISRVSSRLSGV